MSLFSRIMKPLRKTIEQRTPMPPRTKGGLAGLIQRTKDKRLERPISIGGVGGGVGITKSPLAQAAEKLRNSIQPVPVLPGQEGQLPIAPVNTGPMKIFGQTLSQEDSDRARAGGSIRDYFERINAGISDEERAALPSAFGPTQRQAINPATGQPYTPTQEPELGPDLLRPLPGSLGPPIPIRADLLPPKRDPIMSIGGLGGGRPMPINVPGGGGIDYGGGEGPPLLPLQPPTDDPFLRPRVDAIGGQQLIPQVNATLGQSDPQADEEERRRQALMLAQNRVNLREAEASIREAAGGERGGRGPIPPQDFGFGPGIRPTEIREPDGRIIGPAGVTPPDFVKNIENKGPGSLRGRIDLDRVDLDRFVPPQPPQYSNMIAELPPERIAEIGDPIRDEGVSYLGGSPTFNEQGSVAAGDALQNFINNQTPVAPTVDPVTTAPTPSATTEQGTDPIQSMPAPVGALDPVLLGQTAQENLNDPLVRALYFGTQDQPGFYQQLQQAGANLIGQDVPLQQTAGLTPLELLARQQAVAGLGGFEPFLQQNRQLVEQAIAQSRRAEELRDPYYGIAEQQLQTGLGEELGGIGQARGITTGATDRFGRSLGGLGRQAIGSTAEFGGRLGESEDLFRGTVGGYDQGLTQQFYNPFEDAVVQRTIEDVMEAGDKQDIASRAREISAGAFGGSRARLGAQERREALGEGLAKALGSIRQQGFSEAQRTGLSEFARQRAAERAAASGLSGLATSRLGAQQQLGSTLRGLTGDQFAAQQQLASNLMGYGAAGSQARQNLASGMLGIGQQRGAGASALGQQLAGYGSQIGGIGSTQEGLRAGQRGELAGYGGIGRGIAETGLSRIYQQQLGQQQRPLGVLGQIGSMLPGYQQTSTQIGSQYGLPTDPSAAGLGAAFSAYGALAPRQGQS